MQCYYSGMCNDCLEENAPACSSHTLHTGNEIKLILEENLGKISTQPHTLLNMHFVIQMLFVFGTGLVLQ